MPPRRSQGAAPMSPETPSERVNTCTPPITTITAPSRRSMLTQGTSTTTGRTPLTAPAVPCDAQLMVILDNFAGNVAMPDMAKGLDITGSDIGWTITSYSLIFGSLLL